MTPTTDKKIITMIDPALILAEDNARFNLKSEKVADLAQKILDSDGVNTPVEVEDLEEPVGECLYRLTAGFYRHAAVTKLNSEGAGLSLPCIIHANASPLERLRRQLSENVDRENLSPMDTAVALAKLREQGVSEDDIRAIFARPGGRKGNVITPASRAWVRNTTALLSLPKGVQEKIHDGRIGVATAYELTRLDKDKVKAVLERAEADRLKALDAEESADERIETTEAKIEAKQSKLQEAESALATAEEAKKSLLVQIREADEAVKKIKKTPVLDLEPEERKKVGESLVAAKAAVRTAYKELNKTSKDAEKIRTKLDKLNEALDAKAKAKAEKKVRAKDIQKAAAKEGASEKFMALNANEMRSAVAAMLKSRYPMVRAIGEALDKCFKGQTSEGMLLTDLSVLTGERETKKAGAKK